jgi:hypothetical protein
LDGKYRTTSFFGIKLLKYPFGKKINLKNAPQKRLRFEKEKKKKKKKKRRRRTVGSLACSLGEATCFSHQRRPRPHQCPHLALVGDNHSITSPVGGSLLPVSPLFVQRTHSL